MVLLVQLKLSVDYSSGTFRQSNIIHCIVRKYASFHYILFLFLFPRPTSEKSRMPLGLVAFGQSRFVAVLYGKSRRATCLRLCPTAELCLKITFAEALSKIYLALSIIVAKS